MPLQWQEKAKKGDLLQVFLKSHTAVHVFTNTHIRLLDSSLVGKLSEKICSSCFLSLSKEKKDRTNPQIRCTKPGERGSGQVILRPSAVTDLLEPSFIQSPITSGRPTIKLVIQNLIWSILSWSQIHRCHRRAVSMLVLGGIPFSAPVPAAHWVFSEWINEQFHGQVSMFLLIPRRRGCDKPPFWFPIPSSSSIPLS